MSAPFVESVMGGFRPEYLREIDRDYHLETIAHSSKENLEINRRILDAQARLAQDRLGSSESYHTLSREFSGMSAAIERLTDSVRDTHDAVRDVESAIFEVQDILKAELRILQQQQQEANILLKDIALTLRRPLETQAVELRNEADRWIESGMNRSGRDQADDYTDAYRLLKSVVANPIGMQDYLAWFQIGWLAWKHENSLKDAEDCFYRAQRLSERNNLRFFVRAVRHLAYMQYHQENFKEAYATIQKALAVEKEHDTLFDGARYAVVTDHPKEAISLLEQCIRLKATTSVVMFSEDDFQSIESEMTDLYNRLLDEMRRRVFALLEMLQEDLNLGNRCIESASVSYQLSGRYVRRLGGNQKGLEGLRDDVRETTYMQSVSLEKNFYDHICLLHDEVKDVLKASIAERQRSLARLEDEWKNEERTYTGMISEPNDFMPTVISIFVGIATFLGCFIPIIKSHSWSYRIVDILNGLLVVAFGIVVGGLATALISQIAFHILVYSLKSKARTSRQSAEMTYEDKANEASELLRRAEFALSQFTTKCSHPSISYVYPAGTTVNSTTQNIQETWSLRMSQKANAKDTANRSYVDPLEDFDPYADE